MLWRMWKEGNVPLHELMNRWTYEELVKGNAVLDMYQSIDIAYDALMEEEMKRPGGK